MEKQPTQTKQAWIATGMVLAWLALAIQLYLILVNRKASVPETLIRYFTFYTILTNLLVALCYTSLLNARTGWLQFFSRPSVLAATAVYIFVVGAVYNTILRFLWQPQGVQFITDELLHTVNPIVYVMFWLLFASKQSLVWKNVLPWLWYPFIYVAVVLLRGQSSGYYPYPFVDVSALGFSKVIVNCIILFIIFLALSLLTMAIARRISRNTK